MKKKLLLIILSILVYTALFAVSAFHKEPVRRGRDNDGCQPSHAREN